LVFFLGLFLLDLLLSFFILGLLSLLIIIVIIMNFSMNINWVFFVLVLIVDFRCILVGVVITAFLGIIIIE